MEYIDQVSQNLSVLITVQMFLLSFGFLINAYGLEIGINPDFLTNRYLFTYCLPITFLFFSYCFLMIKYKQIEKNHVLLRNLNLVIFSNITSVGILIISFVATLRYDYAPVIYYSALVFYISSIFLVFLLPMLGFSLLLFKKSLNKE